MAKGARVEFELTDAELAYLLNASRPVPYLIFGGMGPRSPQENANDAWRQLGKARGFQWDTVQPVYEKPSRFFSAEVNEITR